MRMSRGVEDIRAPVLGYFKILAGALLLHQMVLPAAGLGALAAVRVAAGEVI